MNVLLQYFHRVDDEWVFKTPLQTEQMCPSVWFSDIEIYEVPLRLLIVENRVAWCHQNLVVSWMLRCCWFTSTSTVDSCDSSVFTELSFLHALCIVILTVCCQTDNVQCTDWWQNTASSRCGFVFLCSQLSNAASMKKWHRRLFSVPIYLTVTRWLKLSFSVCSYVLHVQTTLTMLCLSVVASNISIHIVLAMHLWTPSLGRFLLFSLDYGSILFPCYFHFS